MRGVLDPYKEERIYHLETKCAKLEHHLLNLEASPPSISLLHQNNYFASYKFLGFKYLILKTYIKTHNS